MKKISFIAACCFLTAAASCTAGTPARADYDITARLTSDDDGSTAYIINYDNKAALDSAIVDNGRAIFKGKIENPVLARLIVNGAPAGTFILEPGKITLAAKEAHGSPLNERMDSLDKQMTALVDQYHKLPKDTAYDGQREEIIKKHDEMLDYVMLDNMDNPIGYYLFLQKGMELNLQELQQALEQYPSLKQYVRINKLLDAAIAKDRTSEGKKMVDFTIETPDGPKSLSDYVGRGKYTLVDFWASWCGPCIRETATIKRIRDEFGPKGLDILGVAVWDEPANTERAIRQHDLTWPQIINAQSRPTDLYGISGIPCIILFGPDGTIISRDQQGDDLIEAVRNAIDK